MSPKSGTNRQQRVDTIYGCGIGDPISRSHGSASGFWIDPQDVVEIVAVKAHWNHSEPQFSTEWPQRIQSKVVIFSLISTGFNKSSNLVRDQGVGGSNPLSPTKYLITNNLD
jgi:hypothetical protein